MEPRYYSAISGQQSYRIYGPCRVKSRLEDGVYLAVGECFLCPQAEKVDPAAKAGGEVTAYEDPDFWRGCDRQPVPALDESPG